MAIATIRPGQAIMLDKQKYIINRSVGDRLWQLEKEVNGKYHEYAEDELHRLFVDGRIEFLTEHDTNHDVIDSKKEILFKRAMDQLPDDLKEEARMRFAYVSAVNQADLETLTPKTLKPIIGNIWKKIEQPKKPPNWTTVYRWHQRYRRGGNDIRSLVTQHHKKGNAKRRVRKRLLEIVCSSISAVYLTRERCTIQDALDDAIVQVKRENRLLPKSMAFHLPSYSLIRREVYKIEVYDRYLARHGYVAARNKFRYAGSGVSTERPFERAEIDHTVLDIMVVDDENYVPLGRPTLTICMDHFTRCVLGIYLGFEPPSFSTVAQCLKHAFLPKIDSREKYNLNCEWAPHGVMETLVVDHGLEFHSHGIEDLCATFGINIQYCQRKTPWYKGSVERLIGTVNQGVAHGIPGTTFSNILEKDDYDVAKNATVTLSTLMKIVNTWVVDYYHKKKHTSLGQPPIKVWEENINKYPVLLPTSVDDIDSMIGQVVTRSVTHKGIFLHGLRYNSNSLHKLLRNKGDKIKAVIRYNPADLGHVYVVDELDRNPIKVPCLSNEYAAGLSLYQHEMCKKYAKEHMERCEIEDLAEAKDRIRSLIQKDFENKRKKTRKAAARFRANENADKRKELMEEAPEPARKKQKLVEHLQPRVFGADLKESDVFKNIGVGD